MGVEKTAEPRRRWLRRAVGLAAPLLLTGLGAVVFRACFAADPGEPRALGSHLDAAEAVSGRIEIPKFGRPEEAKRYFDAMTQGDQRAIELLDRALAEARARGDSDPEQIAELERTRAARAARLAAYQAARP